MNLFENKNTGEIVTCEKWKENTTSEMSIPKGGEELFILVHLFTIQFVDTYIIFDLGRRTR
jgi:hypothetical protein